MHTLARLLAIPLVMISLATLAAPKAELWERWTRHDQSSTETIDHSTWNELLQKYVVEKDKGPNLFRYAAVSMADKTRLKSYLDGMQKVTISSYNRAEQRAYWINLYNARTIDVVLAHYPVESILDIDISPGFFSKGPWKKKLLTVEGEEISLDDIEHRILRPIWKDPLLHYTVNCASIGCPDLATKAYTADNYDELANAGAVAYVNDLRGADARDGRLRVSSIYEWFKTDFGGDDRSVIAHLRQYAEPKLKKELEQIRKISGHDYDWSLNGAK